MKITHNLFSSLNPEQRKAVENTQGPLLVLAGAGTGKTKTLTHRLAYILQKGLSTHRQILAVTFTNKAATAMRTRLQELLQFPLPAFSFVGTFHACASKILRQEAHKSDVTETFTIISEREQNALLKTLLTDNNINNTINPKGILYHLHMWKQKALRPKDVLLHDSENTLEKIALKLYPAYQRALVRSNACDFDDLLLKTLTIFKENDSIRQKYQNLFRYISVDEYQDTNLTQRLWLEQLVKAPEHNICCVGDEDQSIYSWRGAAIENILNFPEQYDNCQVVHLETNYRSTKPILEAANSLIKHNTSHLGKILKTDKDGEPVSVWECSDQYMEASVIVQAIEQLQQQDVPLKSIAILTRTSAQSGVFEEKLLNASIPYTIIGNVKFYQRQEIQDMLSYLRLLHNPHNNLAFRRAISIPKQGIGPKTLATLEQYKDNMSIIEALEHAPLSSKMTKALKKFSHNLYRWKDLLASKRLGEVFHIVLEESGYKEIWDTAPILEKEARLANLEELKSMIETFQTLDSFLEHASFATDMSAKKEQGVLIMTLHAAKGLEFDYVFLPGWEQGLCPHNKSMDEPQHLEEERRLAYVGLTRAKTLCIISYTQSRVMFGKLKINTPSMFIDEIPTLQKHKFFENEMHALP